mmetsp:Transcript_13634/g.21494  ORF Transcript_13634/g.21494 Transcript_13634/m.21494 type:complete len:103 (+) Transcript_13634:137-445(+)
MKKLCKIEGEKVHDVSDIYEQVGSQIVPGDAQWEKNMDSFNDILSGAFRDPGDDDGIAIVWEHAEESQRSLGDEKFQQLLKAIRDHGPEGKKSQDQVRLHLA